MNQKGFAGSWRCWSSMKIDGDERIPMLFRLWPEPWDNSARYGATNIWNTVVYNPATSQFDVNIKDNGFGFSEEGEQRFLQLAAESDANEASRYGWGLKAFIATASPQHDDPWEIATRYKDTARPNIFKSPYAGKFTKCVPGPADILFPSGTSITVHPDASKFSTPKESYSKTSDMAKLFKEIVCVRYSEDFLRTVRFHFIITGADGETIEMDSWSQEWHSLEWSLKKAVDQKMAKILVPETIRPFSSDGRMKVRHIGYQLNPLPKKKDMDYGALQDFPLYGRRNIDSTLIHHFNNQRMIEAVAKGVATGKRFHNSENGQIAFVQFIPMDPERDYGLMPRPATIKTSYLDTTEEWRGWITLLKEIYNNPVEESVEDSSEDDTNELFADDPVLKKRFRVEQENEAVVETHISPNWIGLPMGIKTVQNGTHTIILHRQKMNDVETDFTKAHLTACQYATEHSLEPNQIQVILILSIKDAKKRTERMETLRNLKQQLQGRYFPLVDQIDFETA